MHLDLCFRDKIISYKDKGVKNILSHELRTIFRREIGPGHNVLMLLDLGKRITLL